MRALTALVSCLAFAQPPAFDVASVNRIVGPSGGVRHETRPGTLSLRGVPLGYCVRWAYGLPPYRTDLTVGADWIDPPNAEFYEIVAKTAAPEPVERLRIMLQTLLADRFQLVLHRERRLLSVLAVTVAKEGHKFARSTNEDGRITPRASDMTFDCQGCSMERLVDFLDRLARLPGETRPVVDGTGLHGTFDFTLDLQKFREFDNTGAPVLDASGRVDLQRVISRALPDLGLRLESKRVPVEVLVIDRAQKEPSGN